jgi:hypothetical protein
MVGVLVGVVVIGLLAYAGVRLLVSAEPASVLRAIRIGVPAVLAMVGVGCLALGQPGIGGVLMGLAAIVFGVARSRRAKVPAPRRRSSVRTAALEMQLDHETGILEGIVLAGRHEDRLLATLSLDALLEVLSDLASDSESRQLFETYLDGRFPGWRQNPKAHIGDRQGVAPRPGAMTEQEAYKILGLEAGASAADIRKAHRRLMQRLHPGVTRGSLLAARIDEAKKVLLASHD